MQLKKIGIFDSGLGGLTILRSIAHLPFEQIIYYADTANLPYGAKSEQQLQSISHTIVDFFMEHRVDAIIIACHTMSTIALEYLQHHFPYMIFMDVVHGVVHDALQITRGVVGIIATTATINNHGHKQKLLALNAHLSVVEQACPLLVPLLEAHASSADIDAALREYLLPLHHVDTLILGCTHYALLKKAITAILPSVHIISAENAIARHYKQAFEGSDALTRAHIEYYSSGDSLYFQRNYYNLAELLHEDGK